MRSSVSDSLRPDVKADYGSETLNALAEWLLENPGCTPQEAANRFGVPVDFVREVEDARGTPTYERLDFSNRLAQIRARLRSFGESARNTFRSMTESPYRFLILSTGIAVIAIVLVGVVDGILGATPLRESFSAGGRGTVEAILLLLIGLHAGCFVRHGNVRVPGMFSVGIFVLMFAVMQLAFRFVITPDSAQAMVPFGLALIYSVFIAAMVAGAYFLFGATFSLLGGFAILRDEAMRRRRRSRQELLDRFFVLQERLVEASQDPGTYGRLSVRFSAIRDSSRYLFLALGVGLGVGLLQVLVVGGARINRPIGMGNVDIAEALLLLFVVLTSGAFGTVCYFAGNVRKALMATVVMIASVRIPQLIPYGGYGPDTVWDDLTRREYWVMPLFWLGNAILVGSAAYLEDRAYRRNRLRANDPASMVAEMMEIKALLSPKESSTCVVVVDVSKSTRMKANADPLSVEWSFREFQELVARQAASHGGTVLSTAGDGAILTFAGAEEALAAARSVHRELEDFNLRKNRLSEPFRVRIGIHQGRTDAELDKVQFNQVIDIAAHVQESAPVGGIGITEPVVQSVPEEAVAEVGAPVDGHRVFYLLNPHEAS